MGDQTADGGGYGAASMIPQFDIALWGYDREQVEECLTDLAVRLDEALGRLTSVELLQAQLYQTQEELDRLRRNSDEPSWSVQLANIMEAAEQLRGEAEREAEAARTRSGG